MNGRQRKVLQVVADAGPTGITSISQAIAKAAGRKPSHMISLLKDMGYVRNLNASRVVITDLGREALGATSPQNERAMRRRSR